MLLGLHTYSLHLHGIGQAWAGYSLPWPRQLTTFQILETVAGLGLDGLQLDDGALESLERPFLEDVRDAARSLGLYIEYNFSMDTGSFGVGLQHDPLEAIETAAALNADVVKLGLELVRPRPLAAGRFHPDVMAQLEKAAATLGQAAPAAQAAGIRLAVENHCDTFSDEILWLLDRVNHPAVGACIDTVNAMMVTEDPMAAIEKLTPRAYTNHFKDHRVELHRYGMRMAGTALGDGDIDLRRAYDLIRTQSPMKRLTIEIELGVPITDMETCTRQEMEAVRRSIRYCREVLGVRREDGDA